MPADKQVKIVSCLPAYVGISLAVLAGGCSMKMPESMRYRPPAMEVRPGQVVALESKAIDDGVALVGEGKYVEAQMQFRRAEVWHRAAGDKGKTAECLFWIGFCVEKQGKIADACEQYKRVVRDYPKTAAAGQATARLGRLKGATPAGKGG